MGLKMKSLHIQEHYAAPWSSFTKHCSLEVVIKTVTKYLFEESLNQYVSLYYLDCELHECEVWPIVLFGHCIIPHA